MTRIRAAPENTPRLTGGNRRGRVCHMMECGGVDLPPPAGSGRSGAVERAYTAYVKAID